MTSFSLGEAIPSDTAHAVSVSLPTWRENVGYEEGESAVMSKLTTGYPRFFIHKIITAFARDIVDKYGRPGQGAMLFPTKSVARSCLDFVKSRCETASADASLRVLELVLAPDCKTVSSLTSLAPAIYAVIHDDALFPLAKQYWQHTGAGVSSRRAEFCYELYKQDLLVPATDATPAPRPSSPKSCRGPRRYHRHASISEKSTAQSKTRGPFAVETEDDAQEGNRFVEERFGRNLDLSLVQRAKSAIRRRISGAMSVDVDRATPGNAPEGPNSRGIVDLSEEDVYLFPCGMNAIFNVHRALSTLKEPLKSINFGFPYVDTLKILEKFGPGCLFYGNASTEELDDLERRLKGGERFLALFCEFPGNPLLTCPDLRRIRQLADDFGFFVVVDETIGTFANVNVLPFSDVVVSSLTKIFSGDCNVMGGSAILNPGTPHYAAIKAAMGRVFEDIYWAEDVVFMERNSRDFQARVDRINANSDAICDVLMAHPSVKRVYYPKHVDSRANYEVCRLPAGGYGGLFSVTFHCKAQSVRFFDALETAKGPSLGTNFTLTCPYVLIAHYQELEWAAQYGADVDLIRVSVGLEETDALVRIFEKALEATKEAEE